MANVTVLPFVSVLDDQPDCRFPVTVYRSKGNCELSGQGDCSTGEYYLGDDDLNSARFCFKHFHSLHDGQSKQSHIEPMNEEELLMYFRGA